MKIGAASERGSEAKDYDLLRPYSRVQDGGNASSVEWARERHSRSEGHLKQSRPNLKISGDYSAVPF